MVDGRGEVYMEGMVMVVQCGGIRVDRESDCRQKQGKLGYPINSCATLVLLPFQFLVYKGAHYDHKGGVLWGFQKVTF